MSKISSKLPNIGVSIFTKMTALANSAKAINLSQGFPNFEPHEFLKERISYHIQNGKNQYAPATGVPELREQLSLKYPKYDAQSEITVTSGASEALFVAIATVVKKGDEVIVIEPAYDLYVPAIELQGGIPVFVSMKFPDYSIDWDEVESKISNKTSLIIINTPHNPTGKVLQKKDIEALENIVQKFPQVFLLSDEVYEHILFDGNVHLSLADSEILKERSFICSSFAKTFHITGWKIGYCLAPKNLSEEFRKIHQYVTFCSFTPAQYALADFLEKGDLYSDLSDFYQKKKDLFSQALSGSGFELLKSEGTFFLNASYKKLSSLKDTEFAEDLVQKAGVATIPISVFYKDQTDNNIIRFCFAKEDQTLLEAAERLVKFSDKVLIL